MTATEHLEELCRRRGLSVLRDIHAHNRKQEAFELRREIACELFCAGYGWSEIGRAMKRHHTTIMHAVGKEAP